MDLRFTVFNLIFRDAVLRSLLLNYADRIEYGRLPERTESGACYVSLKWTDDNTMSAPAGAQLLTAQVHMPRHRSDEKVCLDAVLQRLRTALPLNSDSAAFTVRCRETTRDVMDSGVGTIFKASTFEIAPVPLRRVGGALLELPPWTGFLEVRAAHLALSGLVPPGPGSPALN
jgi:hypothetical protein